MPAKLCLQSRYRLLLALQYPLEVRTIGTVGVVWDVRNLAALVMLLVTLLLSVLLASSGPITCWTVAGRVASAAVRVDRVERGRLERDVIA